MDPLESRTAVILNEFESDTELEEFSKTNPLPANQIFITKSKNDDMQDIIEAIKTSKTSVTFREWN